MNIGDNSKVFIDVSRLSDNDKNRLANACRELSNSYTRQEAEGELQREMLQTMMDDVGIEKKLLRQISRAYHKQNVHEVRDFNNRFDESYDQILGKEDDE